MTNSSKRPSREPQTGDLIVPPGFFITPFADALCQVTDCTWLVDWIVANQRTQPDIFVPEEFQVYTLTVDRAHQTGHLVCTDGNDHELQRQFFPVLACKASTVTLWYVNKVIMLPGEY